MNDCLKGTLAKRLRIWCSAIWMYNFLRRVINTYFVAVLLGDFAFAALPSSNETTLIYGSFPPLNSAVHWHIKGQPQSAISEQKNNQRRINMYRKKRDIFA